MINVENSVNKGFDIVKTAHQDTMASLKDNLVADVASPVSDRLFELDFVDLFGDILSILEVIAVVVSVAILIGLIVVVLKVNRFAKKRGIPEPERIPEPASGGMLTGKWAEIMDHMQSERETEWKLAVIEADKLLNDILAKAGFPGGTMGERLVGMRHEQLRTLPYLWQAHLLRNKIVHETNYSVKYQEIHEALRAYKASLEELGVL